MTRFNKKGGAIAHPLPQNHRCSLSRSQQRFTVSRRLSTRRSLNPMEVSRYTAFSCHIPLDLLRTYDISEPLFQIHASVANQQISDNATEP